MVWKKPHHPFFLKPFIVGFLFLKNWKPYKRLQWRGFRVERLEEREAAVVGAKGREKDQGADFFSSWSHSPKKKREKWKEKKKRKRANGEGGIAGIKHRRNSNHLHSREHHCKGSQTSLLSIIQLFGKTRGKKKHVAVWVFMSFSGFFLVSLFRNYGNLNANDWV